MGEDHADIFTIVSSRSFLTSLSSSPTCASYRAVTSGFAVPNPHLLNNHLHQLQHQLLLQLLLQLLHQPQLKHLLPPVESVEQMQNGSRQELSVDVLPTLMNGHGLLLWFTKTGKVQANIVEQHSSQTPMFLQLPTASNRSSNRI